MLIDLQAHSTYSDGYLTPTEVARFIARQGVKVAALTDHNTVGGLDEFKRACQQYGVKPIVGIELYVKLNNQRTNILWYNFDDNDPLLHDILRESQVRRRRQARNILERLLRHGFKFDVNKVLDKYNHYVPMNRIISDIVAIERNLAKIKKELAIELPREEEIISRYFHNKEIGILRPSYINIERIFKLRKRIGGQIILNHPAKHSYVKREFWQKLKNLGLDGVEILSPHHSIGAVMQIQQLARELDFITTGGSDFHRLEGNNYLIQHTWQYFKIDTKYLQGVKNIIG